MEAPRELAGLLKTCASQGGRIEDYPPPTITVTPKADEAATQEPSSVPLMDSILSKTLPRPSLLHSWSDETVLSEATCNLRKDLDDKLERLVLSEEPEPPIKRAAEELPTQVSLSSKSDPFAFACAWGFSGDIAELPPIPTAKEPFLVLLRTELVRIDMIQNGMLSYMQAINSRKHHKFSTKFLINQNTATVITIDQLDKITEHLTRVQKEVEVIEDDECEVRDELVHIFKQAQPWIARTRAILVESHIFYKINYVLASDKKTTKTKVLAA